MRVVLFLLKCLVGLFATIGFLVTLAVFAFSVGLRDAAPWQAEAPEVPEMAVLSLDLAGGVIEKRPDNLLSRASLGRIVVLRQVVAALRRAETDDRVKGLVVRLGSGPIGFAQAQELRSAVLRFRDSGRFAIAFTESFGEAGNGTLDYYLASAFDDVWLQPSGDLAALGILVETAFLKGTLEKLGIVPRLGQREEYKGAMNIFTDESLPAPQRENLQRLVDSWMAQIITGIAEGRKTTPEAVRALIDRSPLTAGEAKDAGLVDKVGYWDEVMADVDDRSGADTEFLAVRHYAARTRQEEETGPKIAVIYGLGPIALAEAENDPLFGSTVFGSDTIARAIADAADDEEVQAIVFRVDSPGGSYVASDTIHREVMRAGEQGKPVIVSMGNLAASGGYFVSMGAQSIVAQPGTVTGSIGVVAGKFVLSGLWDKLGMTWDGVQAGDNAGLLSANRDFTDAQWQQLQSSLDRIYADFTNKVAKARELTPEATDAAARGRVWTGEDAMHLGLVDELGGFDTALDKAKVAAGLDASAEVVLKVFPEERDGFGSFVENLLGSRIESTAATRLLAWVARAARILDPILTALENFGGGDPGQPLLGPNVQPAG